MNRALRPLAVALISASTLAYEILLVRVFAIEEFYHFAYMAIGVAMLGFGAAGTFLALARPRAGDVDGRGFVWAALLTPFSLILSPALVHQIPVDVAQLAWDPAQWPRLGLVYLLLALPFGFGGLTVLVALTREPERTGVLYGAGFLGSGAGAALALASLWVVFPTRALALPALIAALGATAAALGERDRLARAVCIAGVAATILVVARPLWRLEITPYKGLPQVEAYPDARRTAERASPLGWVVAVEADAFRHAPGLSLAYRGEFPSQTALFVDAQLAGAATRWTVADTAMAGWLPSALPHVLGPYSDVLVVGAGGGMDVSVASFRGAERILALELNPDLVELANRSDGAPVGREAAVRWAIGDARSRLAGLAERFDLITLGPGRGFAAATGGVHALNEDYLHTVEAYSGYLERLSDEGVLAITRWLTVPPRESLRVILTSVAALWGSSPDHVDDGLIVVRSWATATVLVKPSGFSDAEVDSLAAWATSRRFDLDWYPGIESPRSRFNVLDDPTLFRAAAAAVGEPADADSFVNSYLFAVGAVGDERPYPHHFLRLGSLGTFLRQGAGQWLPFAEWGYVALLATLAQSLVLSVLLLLVPVVIAARGSARVSYTRVIGYFAAIGFAYLAAEIAAIQQLSLLLGHPVYSVAVVLAVFLIASGAGSAWSDQRRGVEAGEAALVLAASLVAYAALLLTVVHWIHPAPLAVRGMAAAGVLLPLAFVMGLPFPLGLRHLCGGEGEGVAWAWAANGFASVVATPLAALIALEAGSRVLLFCAGLAYAVAAATLLVDRHTDHR